MVGSFLTLAQRTAPSWRFSHLPRVHSHIRHGHHILVHGVMGRSWHVAWFAGARGAATSLD